MKDERLAETLELVRNVWIAFLVALYGVGYFNSHYFPGIRQEPLEGEAIFWNLQRLFFFGLMAAGFLMDVIQMREDRHKAYRYLLLSLLLGGLSSTVTNYQYNIFSKIFGGG
jgi:hypothetical protein